MANLRTSGIQSRPRFRNPPVHEVILDIRLHGALGPDPLRAARSMLPPNFGEANELLQLSLTTAVGSTAPSEFSSQSSLVGWEFRQQAPHFILRLQKSQLTLHLIRSSNWPDGEYIGWERIAKRFQEAHAAVGPLFADLRPRRVGLRYINRLAVPTEARLEDWFNFQAPSPSGVKSLHMFSIHHTWEEISGHDGLSVSIRLGKVPVPDGAGSPGSSGILFDLDVFNLHVKHAPSWDDVPDWFEEAHLAENGLFREYITTAAESSFDQGVS